MAAVSRKVIPSYFKGILTNIQVDSLACVAYQPNLGIDYPSIHNTITGSFAQEAAARHSTTTAYSYFTDYSSSGTNYLSIEVSVLLTYTMDYSIH